VTEVENETKAVMASQNDRNEQDKNLEADIAAGNI
jgi:hypothetical protein